MLSDFSLDQYCDICPDCHLVSKHCYCLYEAHSGFEPQSGTTGDANIHTISKSSTQQNVQFTDQLDPYIYDIESNVDPTRRMNDSNDATLENFFSRPIKIWDEEWGTGTGFNFTIDPWSLYWDNPRVANRISNFNLLRANLHVKIMINGNGFQYGRVLAAYLPFSFFDTLSTNAGGVTNDLIGTSQLPHVYLDPTTSTGGEMKLPMFNYYNYMNITDSQWEEMGTLLLRSLNDLKHANGATDVSTISVFAWAEDVSMSVLTSVESSTIGPQSGFEPQSGEIEEANSKGTISGPATAISKWAAYLTKVPYIGPFATATTIGAGATAKIAQLFGYSRPPVTKNPEPYRPTPFSSLALTNVPDTSQKITVDHKQELSVDPRIAGIGGVDQLNIREIAKRESYLTKFTWAVGTAPETILWNATVDPVTWAETATAGSTVFHFPACAFAALPFQYWTGSMKFRFQIVASTFHKGRLKIVYDPNFFATNEYNTNYLRVVDISEEQDFTIEVGPAQERTLLDHHNPGIDSVTQMYSTTAYTSQGKGNGVLGVYVVNELTTPNSTANNDIEINVFVSMGDDFEVFVPDDHFQNFTTQPEPEAQSGVEIDGFEPQSSEIVPDGQNTAEPSAPQQSMSTVVGMNEVQNPDLNKVFTGESIVSFRTMLKRYGIWSTINAFSNSAKIAYGRRSNFPYFRGYTTDAVDQTAAGDDYSYCNNTMLHWVRLAYSGWRGSVRYKIVPRGTQDINENRFEIQRAPHLAAAPLYSVGTDNLPTFANAKAARKRIVRETSALGVPDYENPFGSTLGMALTVNSVNGCLEFEVPYYSPYRFTPGKSDRFTGFMGAFDHAWDYRAEIQTFTSSTFDVYVAAGEDFQTYFFTGLPRMYYESAAPT